MYGTMALFGHYYIEGVGYATIQDILTGHQTWFTFLFLLFGLKLLVTSLTLGSGASGGIFSPALFLGATLGAAYGILLHHIYPALQISTGGFAVAGMGGVVGGATGAAMAAIVMIFEMTRDYVVIIPVTITVALSYAVRRMLVRESVYTRKLALRGHATPQALQANLHFVRPAAQIMEKHFAFAKASEKIAAGGESWPLILTDGENNIAGVVVRDRGCDSPPAARSDYVFVKPEDVYLDILEALHSKNATVALVAPAGDEHAPRKIQGVITEHRLLESLEEGLDLFS